MNPRCRLRTIASSLCALALLCAATGAPAQTIYKQVDLAGRITFTDLPDSNLPAQSMTSPVQEATKAPRPRLYTMSSRRAAAIDRTEAARRLGQAQLKRELGAAPLPGEQGQATEAGALNLRYWRRQEKLRQEVDLAQQRANETQRPQLAQQPANETQRPQLAQQRANEMRLPLLAQR